MSTEKKWKLLPETITPDMEVAFAEVWFTKRRAIDDVDMSDAWLAACEAAPAAPADPRMESLTRQVLRLTESARTGGEARDKLQRANDEYETLLKKALGFNADGCVSPSMTSEFRCEIRETLIRHEKRRPGQPTVTDSEIEQFQQALEFERPGSGDLRSSLYETIARLESERDAALAELKTLQDQVTPAAVVVVERSAPDHSPRVEFSDDFSQRLTDMPAGCKVALHTHPAPRRFRGEGVANLAFPTMLRQMWSGGDVQSWVDEQGPLYAWPSLQRASFQSRVGPWLVECFGQVIAHDGIERNHRFLEEALELVQACGASATEAHQLVDYVFARAMGERSQEVGGVMVTLAALCYAYELNMHQAGDVELDRISDPEVMSRIRNKQLAKPAFGPLPGAYPERKRLDVKPGL